MGWTKASIADVKRAASCVDIVGADVDLKKEGEDYVGCCTLPGHKDDTPSLRVSVRKNLWRCHGCGAGGSVVDWLKDRHGLQFREAMQRLSEMTGIELVEEQGQRRKTAEYRYCDAAGATLYTIERWEPGKQGRSKDFLQKRADGVYKKNDVQVLYRLPDVLAAVAIGQPVFVVEGEKAAEALWAIGLTATTHAGGASASATWKAPGFADPLKGATVVLLPDNDEVGKIHMNKVHKAVARLAKSVTIVDLPLVNEGDDVVEWIAAGGTARRLMELVAEAEESEQAAGSWRDTLRWGKERALGSPGNLEIILDHDENLIGLFGYDEFASRVVLRRSPPWRERGATYPRPLVDADVVRLAVYIEQAHDVDFSTTTMGSVIASVADRAAFNPLTDWLHALKWDGTPRLSKWLNVYAGAEDNAYTSAVARAWAVSTVARALEPGCKVDTTLVLEGTQGRGKSTLLRALVGPDWFMDHLPDFSSKDAAILVAKAWVHELSELATLSRSEVEKIKQFLSQRHDVYRAPYAANTIDVPRKCVFAATTNRSDYLRDTTGNRRFWPVKTGRIDIEAVTRDREQIWAEAVAAYKAGEGWHITDPDVLAQASEEQAMRLEADPWLDDIKKFADAQEVMTTSEVLKYLGIETSKRSPRDGERVGGVLRSLGWTEFRERTIEGRVRRWRRTDKTEDPGPSGPKGGPKLDQRASVQDSPHQEAVSDGGPKGPKEIGKTSTGEAQSPVCDLLAGGSDPLPEIYQNPLVPLVHTDFTQSGSHQKAVEVGSSGPKAPSVHLRSTFGPAGVDDLAADVADIFGGADNE
jgi:predicted P-loop ATPase